MDTEPELSRLTRTVHQWEGEILAYHRQRHSNAKTETANLIIEKQRRGAHGYRSFTNYRLRLLVHHGVKWDTQATTKIRGRKPSSSRTARYRTRCIVQPPARIM